VSPFQAGFWGALGVLGALLVVAVAIILFLFAAAAAVGARQGAKAVRDAKAAGRKARDGGVPFEDNPHLVETPLWRAWSTGWYARGRP
jgi:hypothetical protein